MDKFMKGFTACVVGTWSIVFGHTEIVVAAAAVLFVHHLVFGEEKKIDQ